MYRIIHLASSSLDRFYQERKELGRELKMLRERYPTLYGETYGRVLELLNR